MTRKQHIETLTRFSDPCNEGITYTRKQLIDAIKYAIDHLSREWVSRKHHRKLIKMWGKDFDELVDSYQKLSFESKEFEDTIDHLKADKDRLQSNWNIAREANSESIKEVGKLNYLIKTLESDWEKESDKVSSLQNKVKWLSITTAILFIVLLFALFNCC